MSDAPQFGPGFRAELLDLFRWRRDVRRFRPDPLPAGTLERLVAIAALAPSVGLSEPWRFVAVESEARRRAVRASFTRANAAALAATGEERAALYSRLKLAGLDDAPCQFAVYAEGAPAQGHGLGRQTMPETIAHSCAMAVHTLWLAARAEGIGLGWVSILEPEAVSVILEVPEGWTLIGYFCLGYPLEAHDAPELEREGWERRGQPAAGILRR